MKAYSLDFRKRVPAMCDSGRPLREVARVLSVSDSWVRRLMQERLSAAPITIDPIFCGLAWSLIFSLFASTVFTLFVIPVAYSLLYASDPRQSRSDK